MVLQACMGKVTLCKMNLKLVYCVLEAVYTLSLRLLIWKLGGYSGNSLFTWSDGGAWLA